MISEENQDKAISYLLGELSPGEAEAFEQLLARDEELRTHVRETEETLAELASACPAATPAAELRQRVLAIPRLSPGGTAVPLMDLPRRASARPLGWMVATLGLVLVAAALLYDDLNLRKETGRLEGQVETFSEMAAAQRAQLNAEEAAITRLQQQSPLANVKVAALAALAPGFVKTNGVVAWDPQKQRGVVKLAGLPPAGRGKDYQLWVIGSGSSAPISAGILHVAAGGVVESGFAPDHAVGVAEKFAVSVENAGGSASPKGPIVLAGG